MPEADKITEFLRARLANESRLSQQQRELITANSKIAARARALTDEVIEHRREAEIARTTAEALRGKNRQALLNLQRAKGAVKIAERRLWASLESIRDGFALFDADHRIVIANGAFFRPFSDLDCIGIGTSYEEPVDIAVEEGLIDPGKIGPQAWADWMKSRWNDRGIEPATLRFWNDRFARLAERRTEDGDIVMLAIDMTASMRREKMLEDARSRAEAANRAKSAFLANMSHEIWTRIRPYASRRSGLRVRRCW